MQQHDFMFLLRMVLVGKYDQHYALYCGYGRWKITLSTWDFLWMIHDGVMPSGSLLNSIRDTTTQLAMISSYSLKTQDTFNFHSEILLSQSKVVKRLPLMYIILIMKEAICISWIIWGKGYLAQNNYEK